MKKIQVGLATAVLIAAVVGEPLNDTEPYDGTCDDANTHRNYLEIRPWCSLNAPRYGDPNKFNIYQCNDQQDAYELFYDYDLRYNGSLSFSYTNPESSCPDQSQLSPYPYSFWIGNTGAIEGLNVSRADWDSNPYFMALEYYEPYNGDEMRENLTTHGDAFFMSSTSYYVWGMAWVVRAEPIDSGYSISGELSNTRHNGFNGMRYEIGDCNNFFTGWGFDTEWMVAQCNFGSASMSGTITEQTANVTFTVISIDGDTTYTYAFTGEWTGEGPELVTTGEVPTVTGTRAEVQDSDDDDGDSNSEGDGSAGAMLVPSAAKVAVAAAIVISSLVSVIV
ncbi:hypothetical protein BDY21DRAFT_178060 [Lineolata rhizophorae]|uniref:Uncharacterized protein n=1 Tax=Lineolata rhizophorae TaxID=578093 RepID=A0A6A6P707_9PEZI|nr:hypothetical protein BDY21DRAFT_178060 [Lineolata rhizophorae]